MHVQHFFDKNTSTFTYVVVDTNTNKCAVIDSVLDYDPVIGKLSTRNADRVIDYIKSQKLSNQWLLETHIHADHISAASYLKEHIGGKTAIGSGIVDVLKMWVPLFGTTNDTPIDGQQFDTLFDDNDDFLIGQLKVRVMHTPGHTPACCSYQIEQAVFIGDTLFAPSLGTARADFPGGCAEVLYHSIQKIYQLPDDTSLYLCHDYPDKEQTPTHMSTVKQQKNDNLMLNRHTSMTEFINKRSLRDKSLNAPILILPSIQTNMRLGGLGKATDGIHYIRIPINQF